MIKESLKALAADECRLIRLSTEPEQAEARAGVIDLPMTCFSSGMLEIYIEPQHPRRRLLIIGSLPVAQALAHLPRVCANETGLRRLRQGQVLAPEHFDQQEDGTWEPQAQVCLLDGAGRLAAVAEVQGDLLQPRRVFPTPL